MTEESKKAKKETKEAKRLVLLDVHAILHRAYHALPDFSTSKGEPTGALYGLATMLIKIIADLRPDYITAAYDLPTPTHRHEAYKEYKAGRPKADMELVSQIKRSRDIFSAFGIPTYDAPGFEADDILGTIVDRIKNKKSKAKSQENAGDNTDGVYSLIRENKRIDGEENIDIVIASGDMDTLQLVVDKKVQVYTLKKGIQDTILYDEDAVIKRFGFVPKLLPDYKGLRGDPSDNIIGVKGIGEKTATILIQKFGAIEDIYKALKKGHEEFISAGITPRIIGLLEDQKEEAEFSKILASIRVDAPIEFSLPEKLWAEMVDMERVSSLFNGLEFRTLGARFKEALNKAPSAPAENKEDSQAVLEFKNESAADIETLSVALWLVNSSLTNPKVEDILSFTNAKNPKEAERIIFDEIKKRGLVKVFGEIEKPLLPVIKKMNEKGVKIDSAYLKKLGAEYHKVLSDLEQKIWKEAGGQFNINSPKQIGETLFGKLGLKAKNQKKTSTGALSTRESELEKLRGVHPIISFILEYRELAKLLSTYIDNLPAMVGEDGRLHAKFLQAGTTTGRMSSESPNLQNIPNHTELGLRIRNAFVVERGFKLVSFDYSQIELRVAAFLSGDERLIKIFKEGQDVHSSVASYVFGVSQDKITKEMRRQAKVINFGVMYGMGVAALQKNLGTDRKTAQEFYGHYFESFSGLAKYLDNVKRETSRRGYTETFFGRRRYFEGINSNMPQIKAGAERMAINAPIQGTEADIIKLAMVKIDDFLEREESGNRVFLILQVHDELVYEIEEGTIAKVAPEIKKIMENVLPPEKILGVPIKTDVSVGDNWGEMKKI